MVFVKTWEDFEIAAEALLMEAPEKCRYSMKYAHSKQTLVLKVTNNAKVIANEIQILMFTYNLINLLERAVQDRYQFRFKED